MSEFKPVASAEDLDPGESLAVEVDGEDVALFNVDGDIYAVGNSCSHMNAPLAEGDIDGERLTCPLHGADFDVTTGEALSAPADGPIPCYDVKISGPDICLEVRE